MPVVESVSVDVVMFLCSRSGFGVELVEVGEIWTPPSVVIEDEEALSEDNGSIDGEKEDDNNELAISSADLEKYLADGGSFSGGNSRTVLRHGGRRGRRRRRRRRRRNS